MISKYPIDISSRIKSNLVCVKCSPPHIQGVCDCRKLGRAPTFIKIEDWLHTDKNGRRDYTDKLPSNKERAE